MAEWLYYISGKTAMEGRNGEHVVQQKVRRSSCMAEWLYYISAEKIVLNYSGDAMAASVR